MRTKFPHVLAAATARRRHLQDTEGKDLWAFGAAIIKDCGKPAPPTSGVRHPKANDGSYAKVEACASELKAHGFPEYPLSSLLRIRDTVLAFAPATRKEGLSFYAHQEALNPEILDWIWDSVPKKKTNRRDVSVISVLTIREMVAKWRERHEKVREERLTVAKHKKAQAKSEKEREEAQREIEENASPPKGSDLPPPDKQSPMRSMAAVMDIDVDTLSIIKTLRANQKTINDMVDEIDPEFIDALVEHHQEVATIATQIADRLGKSKLKRFPVIRGGVA